MMWIEYKNSDDIAILTESLALVKNTETNIKNDLVEKYRNMDEEIEQIIFLLHQKVFVKLVMKQLG